MRKRFRRFEWVMQAGFDAVARDSRASFCVIGQDRVVSEELTDYFQSVVVFGRVRVLEGREAADAAYALGVRFLPDPAQVNASIKKSLPRLACFELVPEHVTGKQAIELVPS